MSEPTEREWLEGIGEGDVMKQRRVKDATTHGHYEVVWLIHRSETDVRTSRSIHFDTLEMAREEGKRISRRNRLYIQDENGFPYVDSVKIMRVETTIKTTTVEYFVEDGR